LICYNRRHDRHGHLFQNRYKSIVCEEEAYFLKLVGYLHLNPLRAGLVKSVEELEWYPWSGHAVLMGRQEHSWQSADEVLALFGDQTEPARSAYLEYLQQERLKGPQPLLTGGGLIRSAGG
jgi:putative transposase